MTNHLDDDWGFGVAPEPRTDSGRAASVGVAPDTDGPGDNGWGFDEPNVDPDDDWGFSVEDGDDAHPGAIVQRREYPEWFAAAGHAATPRRRRIATLRDALGTQLDNPVAAFRSDPSHRPRYSPVVVTPGGVAPEGTMFFHDMPSRCPRPELRSASRRDIYWSGDFNDGERSVKWASVKALTQRSEFLGVPAVWPNGLTANHEAALHDIVKPSGFDVRLAALGAVDQWRALTSEQIATCTGYSLPNLAQQKALPALHDSGVFEYGFFTHEASLHTADRRLLHLPVFRMGKSKVTERKILPQLTPAEHMAVTGGLAPESDKRHTRHNLLASEMALRVAEHCPNVSTIVGEKLSLASSMCPGSVSRAAGDFTVVRSDGLRIVVELTNSVGAGFEQKVDRWLKLLDSPEGMFDRTGVVVLFLDASRPEADRSRGMSVERVLRKMIARLVAKYPGARGQSVADRVFVSSWPRFFPGPHLASESFIGLRGESATGPRREGELWQAKELLDTNSLAFHPRAGFEPLDVVDCASLLAGTPYWFRRDTPMEWWNHAVFDATGGYDIVTAPTHDNVTPGRIQGLHTLVRAPRRTRGLARPVHGWSI